METRDPVRQLLERLRGWRVVSSIPTDVGLELRLGDRRDRFDARAVLLIDGVEPDDVGGELLGTSLALADGRFRFGDTVLSVRQIVQGQILDTAAWSVPAPFGDPVEQPEEATSRLVETGQPIWPEAPDIPDADAAAQVLGGIVHQAFAASPLIVSVTRHEPSLGTDRSQMFLTPWTAVEAFVDRADPSHMVVALFPIGELLGRLWERAGLHRQLSGSNERSDDSETTVRISYADEQGVSVGALAWRHTDGVIVASDGEREATSIAAEVLSMMPSSDAAPSEAELVDVSP